MRSMRSTFVYYNIDIYSIHRIEIKETYVTLTVEEQIEHTIVESESMITRQLGFDVEVRLAA